MAKFQKPGFAVLTQATFIGTTGSTATIIAGTTTVDVIKVAALYVSSAAVTVVDFTAPSTTTRWQVQTGVGTGQAFTAPDDEFLFITASSDPVVITSSTGGALFVSVLYERST